MKLVRSLVIALGLLAIVATVALAAPVTDRSVFSGDETVITFDEMAEQEALAGQYSAQGVTFSGLAVATNVYAGAFTWPGSGDPVVANFAGSCPCDVPITATFDGPVIAAGADVLTNDGDFVLLEAYSGGVLVDSADFPTGYTVTFAGLEVPGGFDTLVITAHGPINSAMLMDDFTFEGASTKAAILEGSGVPGKGLGDAPGLQKEFNPNSKAGENAGKK